MRVLGLAVGHDSGLAVVEDGKILFACSEERLTGIKNTWGFPARSLMYACRLLGCGIDDFDKVMVADEQYAPYRIESTPVKSFPLYRYPISVEHHLAHAALAYGWSGWDECTVMTCDGGGDQSFATVNECKDGKIKRTVDCGIEQEALGMLYYYTTEALGFKPNRHEGKVMGLSARGVDIGMFDGLFRVENKKILSDLRSKNPVAYRIAKPKPFSIDGIHVAASCQKHFAETMLEWVRQVAPKKLAVSGGCFANVLCNKDIAKQVESLFVTPSMMDDGLAIGAAFMGFDKVPLGRPESMYLGPESAPRQENQYPASQVAEMVFSGKIVGLFQGRMEFGPRALGNRTILADPRDVTINDKLNNRLRRSEFMPFAPVILEEYADEILEDYQSGIDNAPFMTACWSVKPEWREKLPAVVHVDGTARPQVIKRETNPYYYDIVDEFRKKTGIPVLINTSFNGHESPILAFPAEADWMLKIGQIDVLVEN